MKLNTTHKTVVAAVAILAALALPMVAGAANKLVVRNAGDTADAAVITDTGYIGIGTNTPGTPISIVSGSSPFGTIAVSSSGDAENNAGANFIHTSSSAAGAAAANFSLYRLITGGTLPIANNTLGKFAFGTQVSGIAKQQALITAIAEANFTDVSMPTALRFQTATNPNASVERMRITSSGNVGIGATAPNQKLQVNGGIRLNATTDAGKPACSVTIRGTIWYGQNDVDGDKLLLCTRNSNGTYSWKVVTLTEAP